MSDSDDFLIETEPIEEENPPLTKSFVRLLANFAWGFAGGEQDLHIDTSDDQSFEQTILETVDKVGYAYISTKIRFKFSSILEKITRNRNGGYFLLEIKSYGHIYGYILILPFKSHNFWFDFVSDLTRNDFYEKFVLLRKRHELPRKRCVIIPGTDLSFPLLPDETKALFSWFDKITEETDKGMECFTHLQYMERMKDIVEFKKFHVILKYFDAWSPVKILFVLLLYNNMVWVNDFVNICDNLLGERYLDEVLTVLLILKNLFGDKEYDVMMKRFEKNLAEVFLYGIDRDELSVPTTPPE